VDQRNGTVGRAAQAVAATRPEEPLADVVVADAPFVEEDEEEVLEGDSVLAGALSFFFEPLAVDLDSARLSVR
jgi:hypothetical protein